MPARDVTALAHEWISPALHRGAVAVDATAGAGQDTVFLADAVGPGGRVHAFDIQPDAIERAAAAVASAGVAGRVCLHRACHSRVAEYLGRAAVDAALFNLGWLPGGERSIVTRPKTTLAALDALLARLRPRGRLGVVAYRGHAGGPEEAAAVAAWFAAAGARHRRLLDRPASASPRAPVLHVLERRDRR